jgi:hypothetical protein
MQEDPHPEREREIREGLGFRERREPARGSMSSEREREKGRPARGSMS